MHNQPISQSSDTQRQSYELNFDLVARRKGEILEQLRGEGLGRSEILEQDTGRERLRNLIWDDPSELSLIERCQLIQDVMHDMAKTESAVAP